MTDRQFRLKTWLKNCRTKPTNVRPVVLTIGDQTYDAAFYDDSALTPATRLYVVGVRPPERVAGAKVCYRVPGDDRDWYVAAFIDEVPDQFKEFHFEGAANFILCAWDVPKGDTIDQYEHRPYTRVTLKIEEVEDDAVDIAPDVATLWGEYEEEEESFELPLHVALALEQQGVIYECGDEVCRMSRGFHPAPKGERSFADAKAAAQNQMGVDG